MIKKRILLVVALISVAVLSFFLGLFFFFENEALKDQENTDSIELIQQANLVHATQNISITIMMENLLNQVDKDCLLYTSDAADE